MRHLVLVLIVACAQPTSMMGQNPDASTTHHPDGGGTVDGPGSGGMTYSHAITVIVEPNGNNASELASAINAAKTSVYMTMYEIDNSSIISAIVGRKHAGLDVQVVLDSSSINRSFNNSAYSTFNSAGIPVTWSSTAFTYTHEKTVIIDGKTAWIMTMNMNTSSPNSNREYLAIDTEAADVAEATQIFQADHALQAVTASGALAVAPVNARTKLVALIDSATTTLDLEGEEFSDTYSTGVVRAVIRAAMRGVTCHVVIGNSTPDANSINLVKSVGTKVVVTGPTSGNGSSSNPYIHAKAIVVDCSGSTCARGFVGSENFSQGSLGYNRELGVLFDAGSELGKVKAAIDTDFSRGTPQ